VVDEIEGADDGVVEPFGTDGAWSLPLAAGARITPVAEAQGWTWRRRGLRVDLLDAAVDLRHAA
jgi:hypothetical protein